MAKFLKFEDYRSFIQSLRPSNDESEIFREKLWQMSTHRFTAPFSNGKQLEVEYNFDYSRKEEDRILINVDCLLPLFGNISPAIDEFASLSELETSIRKNVHLNTCSSHRHATCPCRLENDESEENSEVLKPSLATCECAHFHHHCSEHVIYWLKYFLATAILFRETGKCSNAYTAEIFLRLLYEIAHLRERERSHY